MLTRVPDSGSRIRDRQGPRPSVRLTIRDRVRAGAAAGASPTMLAAEFRLSVRTVYRYLAEPEDALRAVVARVLAEARETFELYGLTVDRIDDLAVEIARRIRRGGLA